MPVGAAVATNFKIRTPQGRHVLVPRKFLVHGKELRFNRVVQPVDSEAGPARVFARHLPLDQWERDGLDRLDDFNAAAKVCDTLKMRVSVPDHPAIKRVADVRKFALDTVPESFGTKNQRFSRCTQALLGLNYSNLLEQRLDGLVERFRSAFSEVQRIHPVSISPGRDFLFGREVHASERVKAEFRRLADEGHAYSQFMAGVLLTEDTNLSDRAIRYFVAAHENGVPVALAALGERLRTENFHLDALNCATLSMEGGYANAKSLVDQVRKATAGWMVESPRGYVDLLQYLVRVEMLDDVRTLFYKHVPELRPLTEAQRDEAARAALRGAGSV